MQEIVTSTQSASNAVINGVALEPVHFLIIEDSAFDQKRIKRALANSFEQADLQFATTLDNAREVLRKHPVSIVLLDNNLPDGMGANFAIELAKDARFKDLPVIMVSDWPSPFMWDKARSAGVLFVLTKEEFHAGYVKSALTKSRRLQS